MSDPIFKSVFGADWEQLPPVFKTHYANRPYTTDRITVEGVLDTRCAGPIKWLAPLFWLMGGVPPRSEKDVPITVHFDSRRDSNALHFNRVFYFKNAKPYNFGSRMIPIKGDEVVEVMRFGIGWRMRYAWEDGKVKLKHKGYALKVFGFFLPLPLTALIGETSAEEVAVDEHNFDMSVQITHPLWGAIYEYKGRFRVVPI